LSVESNTTSTKVKQTRLQPEGSALTCGQLASEPTRTARKGQLSTFLFASCPPARLCHSGPGMLRQAAIIPSRRSATVSLLGKARCLRRKEGLREPQVVMGLIGRIGCSSKGAAHLIWRPRQNQTMTCGSDERQLQVRLDGQSAWAKKEQKRDGMKASLPQAPRHELAKLFLSLFVLVIHTLPGHPRFCHSGPVYSSPSSERRNLATVWSHLGKRPVSTAGPFGLAPAHLRPWLRFSHHGAFRELGNGFRWRIFLWGTYCTTQAAG
jgi:hypothetical protein